MSLVDYELPSSANPVDLIEQIAASHDWAFDRSGEDEITISVSGGFCDYNLSMSWMGALEALHLACAFDFKVQERRKGEVMELLALVNEQLWLGHFDLWSEENLPMFRHSIPLRGTAGLSAEQLEDLVDVAIGECERFYPAFQYVVWAGKTPSEALSASILQTVGEA